MAQVIVKANETAVMQYTTCLWHEKHRYRAFHEISEKLTYRSTSE